MKSSSSLLSPTPSPHPSPHPIALPPSSSWTCCPELDLSVTLSPTPKTCHTHVKPRPLKKSQQSEPPRSKPHPRGQTGRMGIKHVMTSSCSPDVCFEEPLVVTVTPEPQVTLNRDNQPQQPVRAQKKTRGRYQAPRSQAEPPAPESNHDSGCLERVELNTTLALKAELQSLQVHAVFHQEAEFNSQRAVQETLQRSKMTKNLINTRATEEVNVSRSQLLFTSLVSVDVREDQLISQVLQEKLLLSQPPRCHGNKAAEGPSPLLFMTSDLFRQKPLPPEEEPANDKLCPVTHHSRSTFDLYRRRTRCEATP